MYVMNLMTFMFWLDKWFYIYVIVFFFNSSFKIVFKNPISAFPRHVHFCHLWNVFLHERSTSRNSGQRLQLWDIRPVNDSSISSKFQLKLLVWKETQVDWLKSNFITEDRMLQTHIHMKTECLQSKERM